MKKEKSAPELPTPTVVGGKASPFGPVRFLHYGGRIDGPTPIAFSFLLPEGEGLGPWREHASTVAAAYLSYLEKESAKAVRAVHFGGLEGTVTEEGILLSASFCPFEERLFRPVARLTPTPDGLLSVHLIKGKRAFE